MQFPITIGLRRSRFLDALVLFGALVASAVVLIFPAPIWFGVCASMVVWALAVHVWRTLAPECAAFRLARDGSLSIRPNASSDFLGADLVPGATVHPWLTVFAFKTDGQRVKRLVLAFDSLSSEDFRRLRVFLRWRVAVSAERDDPV